MVNINWLLNNQKEFLDLMQYLLYYEDVLKSDFVKVLMREFLKDLKYKFWYKYNVPFML